MDSYKSLALFILLTLAVMSGWSYYLVASVFGATALGIIFTAISIADVCSEINRFEQEVGGQLDDFKATLLTFYSKKYSGSVKRCLVQSDGCSERRRIFQAL